MSGAHVQLPGGIRQSSPQRFSEFHIMKRHPLRGFPGGREQPWQGILYHGERIQPQGSPPQFSGAASATLGKWFGTDNPEYAAQYGEVSQYEVHMANPYKMPLSEFRQYDRPVTSIEAGLRASRARRKELAGLGHDGIIVEHADNTMEYILFDKQSARRMQRQEGALDRGFPTMGQQTHAAATFDPAAGHNRPPSGATPVGKVGHGMGHRFHEETLDIETTGLRTKRYLDRFHGRGISERRVPMGITQITRRVHTEQGLRVDDIFTDILDREMLKKHGVTIDQLKSNKPLPESLYREITARASWRRGMKAPWDPSVREVGSVLDKVFRRSAEEILNGNGRYIGTTLDNIMTEWKGAVLNNNKTVRISGWNVNFDFSELALAMREHGLGADLDMLIAKKGIAVRELGEHLHAMQFEHMLQSNWTPVMTDWKAVNIAHQMGLNPLDEVALKKLGASGIHPIRQHTALRSFMDDVRRGVVGDQGGFKSRAVNWAAGKGNAKAQAESVAHNLVNQLSNIKTYEDFTRFAGYLQEHSNNPVFGNSSLYDIFGEWYGTPGAKHVHILGDADAMSVIGRATGQWGSINAFSMISGGKLEVVTDTLLQNATKLQIPIENQERLQYLVGLAHDSKADTEMSEIVHAETRRIRRDQHLSKIFLQEQEAVHRARAGQRLGELVQDVAKTNTQGMESVGKTLQGGGRRMAKRFGNYADNIKAPGWGAMILGFSAMYLVGQNNKVETPEPIQGQRTPISQHDQLAGILPSNLPFSNISAFSSGYDPFYAGVLQYHMEKAKIIKVIDGDTVVFMRDGVPVTGRLAGINTSELNDPHMGHRARAERAAQYLRSTVLGREVGIGLQAGDSVDAYGRELVYLDYQGMSVNQQMVNAGFSGQNAYIPPGQVSPGEGLAYIKFRMRKAVEGVFSELQPWIGSGKVQTDPHMWEIFGGMGDVPYDLAQGYGGEGRPVMASEFGGGYGGYVQRLSKQANMSKVRDYQTQLGRLPGQIRTPKGRHATSFNSHAEAGFASTAMGY